MKLRKRAMACFLAGVMIFSLVQFPVKSVSAKEYADSKTSSEEETESKKMDDSLFGQSEERTNETSSVEETKTVIESSSETENVETESCSAIEGETEAEIQESETETELQETNLEETTEIERKTETEIQESDIETELQETNLEETSEIGGETEAEIQESDIETELQETDLEETLEDEETLEANKEKESEKIVECNGDSEENFVCNGNYQMDSSLINNLKKLDQKLNGASSNPKAYSIQNEILGTGLCPSEGNIHSLVLMVDFADITFADSFTKEYVEQIMFGEPDESSGKYPKESLNAWYQRSSYGKLSFYGEVIEISLEHTKEYYTYDTDANPDGRVNFWEEIWQNMEKLDLDWSAYDLNEDNYLDSSCVIAAGEAGEWASQWWSQVLWGGDSTFNDTYKMGMVALCMESHLNGVSTAIHEFGHCLGLMDLYDTSYSTGDNGGINTTDMMNNDTGDFNAFCKMLLGWIDSDQIQLIEYGADLRKITLDSYTKTGACALLFVDNGNTSIFNEYFLVQYMDFYGNDKEMQWKIKKEQLRIYHVDAQLNESGNYFEHNNKGNTNCKLIEAVDKDAEYVHGKMSATLMDERASVWGATLENEYGCGYLEGDEFTPYTAPSTAKYPENKLIDTPRQYSGLYLRNIFINRQNASFDIYYEETVLKDKELIFVSADDLNGCSANNLKFQVLASSDIWLVKDSGIRAGIREKGETNVVGNVSVREYLAGNYSFEISVDNVTLENATEYEVFFPAGMFITSYGAISKEIIISGIKSETNFWNTNEIVITLDPQKYVQVLKNEYVLNTNNNFEIVTMGINGDIYICELDRETGNLLSESLVVKGNREIERTPKVRSFGQNKNRNYWILTDDSENSDNLCIYIINSNKELIYSTTLKKYKDVIYSGTMLLNNNKLAITYYSLPRYTGYIIDLETFELYSFSEPKIIYPIGEYLLEYASKKYCIKNYEGSIIQEIDLDGLSIFSVIENDNGYSIYGNQNDNIVVYQLDTEFFIKNKIIIFKDAELRNIYQLETGYLIYWCNDISKVYREYRYSLLDKNYDLFSNTSFKYTYCNNILLNGKEHLVVTNIYGNENEFCYQISKQVNISNVGHNILDDIIVSSDIQLDNNGYVIIDKNETLIEFVDSIKPVSDETYSLTKINDQQYIKVSSADSNAEKYYKILAEVSSSESYSVTFDLQGHGVELEEYLKYTDILKGSTISCPPTPTTEGYKFTGWYKEAECTTAWNFETDTVERDITLYAGWEEAEPEKKVYKVTFELQGHGADLKVIEIKEGDKISEPDVPVAEGYKFTGWYKDAECTTAWNFESDTVEGDITLYAGWEEAETEPIPEEKVYKVTFDLQGHGADLKAVEIKEGDKISEPEAPEVEGYKFTGWYKDAECTTAWNFETDTVERDITLYAGWEEAEPAPEEKVYRVTFDLQGHGADLKAVEIKEGDKISEPETPKAEGYKFTGWYKNAECTTTWNFESDTVEGDITLYAGWEEAESEPIPEEKVYKVIFDLQGHGADLKVIEIKEGDKISELDVPAAEGYKFTGWYKDAECTTAWNFETDTVERDITLYAGWETINNDPNKPIIGDVLPEDIPADGKIPNGLWIAGIKDYTYTGKAIKPEVRVYDYDKLLKAGKDYTISYKNNTKANDAAKESAAPAVVVKGKGNYTGIEKETFKILPLNLNDTSITTEDITVAYNKKVQKKVPVVIYNGKKLANNKDFIVSYPDKGTDTYKAAGTYNILLTGKQGGNFTGTKTVKFTITNNTLISGAKVKKIASQTYTGDAIEPELEVTMKKVPLVRDTDYTVAYVNNTEAGTATVILTGIGEYAGTKKVTFKINGTSLKGAVVSGITDKVYNGTAQEQKITVTLNNKPLIEKNDYEVTYSQNTKAGKATVTIKGIKAYSGMVKKTFKITAYDMKENAGSQIGGLGKEITAKYTKGGSKPKLELTFAGKKLIEGTDYKVSYKNNKTVTMADTKNKPTITIKGKGNFKGTMIKNFTIIGKALNDTESPVTLTVSDKGFVDKAGKYISVPILTDADGKKLVAGKDYESAVVYTLEDGTGLTKKSKVSTGTKIKVKVMGKGAYTGELEGVYQITQNDFSKAKISISPQTYTGKAVTLGKDSVTVKIGKETLTFGTDYEIVENSYANNVQKGTASVTIVGKGNYGGTKTVKFRITARKFSWF